MVHPLSPTTQNTCITTGKPRRIDKAKIEARNQKLSKLKEREKWVTLVLVCLEAGRLDLINIQLVSYLFQEEIGGCQEANEEFLPILKLLVKYYWCM